MVILAPKMAKTQKKQWYEQYYLEQKTFARFQRTKQKEYPEICTMLRIGKAIERLIQIALKQDHLFEEGRDEEN